MGKYDDCYDKFHDEDEFDRKDKHDDDKEYDYYGKRRKPYKVCYEYWRRRCYYYDKKDRKDC